MMQRQKSHAMDVKHNEARDKMAEDVEDRMAAENALRQQYRFELEEGKKTPFAYVSFREYDMAVSLFLSFL